MKTIITALAVFLGVHASAGIPDNAFTFEIFVGRGGIGHGCAVNGLLLTSAHLVDPRDDHDMDQPTKVRFRYSFPYGQTGRGASVQISSVADFATIEIDKEPQHGYARLGNRPKKGEKIHWVEYDYRKRKNVFKSRVRKGKVATIFAGHVMLEEGITSGASGGCAYNKDGEVIGLMMFSKYTEDNRVSAGVVGLWGDWWSDVEEKVNE